MSESNALVEKRAKLAAKQEEIKEVFKLAGPDLDFSKKDVLEKLGAVDSKDAMDKLDQRNSELTSLADQVEHERKLEIKSNAEDIERKLRTPAAGTSMVHTVDTKGRTFGQQVIHSKEFQEVAATKWRTPTGAAVFLEDFGVKTLMETTAGFAGESVRTGLLVEGITRPIGILDLIPTRPMNQPLDKYMEETTRTHSAAEKAEGTAYAESVFVWTERTSPVQKITDSIPVTDEQLQDAPQVAGLLDSRLRFGLRQRLDLQVVVGDGTAPNLRGFLDAGFGIATQAKGADPTFDAVFKAMTKVRVGGNANPMGIIFHPNDWQDIRLTRTADGQYIMGNPSTPGASSLFGITVAIAQAITENTALVGDFANFCYIGENRGIDVQVGYVGDQFKEGKKTIRADLRVCFTVPRPLAFCSVTGI
jgi:HK97 family phage major capsid protein